MLQFLRFDLHYHCSGVYLRTGFLFGNLGIKGRVRLPQAYRSLPRPSSLLKPSNPPIGVFTPAFTATNYTTMHDDHCVSFDPLHPSSVIFMTNCIDEFFCEDIVQPCTIRYTKEVIRPQVPLRSPCYDFSLVADLKFDNANKTSPR
jgi:hypothetical protein